MTPRRLPAVLLVLVLLVAGGLADRAKRPLPASSRRTTYAMPVAAPSSALSSTWYCPGATADPRGAAGGSVIVANPTGRAVKGKVTLVPGDPAVKPVVVPIEVPANARTGMSYAEHLSSAWVAALVELDGGGVVAEQSVSGPLGADVMPCAASAADHWYFADGGTTRDASAQLTLFNPFPEDAIVDLSFTTDQGRVVPQALQALVVPGGRLVTINLNDQVLRRRAIATSIVARSGRLVAGRIQTYDGTAGRKGLASVLGTPSPGTLWYFPEGYATDGIVERFQIYNPTTAEARVSLELALEKGAAEPFDLTVPAFGRVTVRTNDEGRVPKGVPHAATVRSQNGVGVVVERSIDGSKPAQRIGLASTMGARAAARQWVFAAGLVTPKLDEWIVVQNPGTHTARLSFTALASGQRLPVEGLQDIELPAGRRTAIRMGAHTQRADLGLLVSSTTPVVAERGLYRVGSIGISSVIGIPLRD